MSTICFEPVAYVESPHKDIQGMPIQPVGALGVRGAIVFDQGYELGLQDMDGFSSIIVIYHLHRCVPGYDLLVKPYLDPTPRGVFATRSPRRPNSIGFSVLKLLGVDGCRLLVENVDILDQTPVLDVKPMCRVSMCGTARARDGWPTRPTRPEKHVPMSVFMAASRIKVDL